MLPKGYHMENKKKYILKNDVVLKHHTNKKGKTTLGKMPFNNTKKKLEQVLNNFLQKNGWKERKVKVICIPCSCSSRFAFIFTT